MNEQKGQSRINPMVIGMMILGLVVGAGGGYIMSRGLQLKIDAYEVQVERLISEVSSLGMEIDRLEALLGSEVEAKEPNTFAQYGFSFEHPEGWTLSLTGMLEAVSTKNSGMAMYTSEDEMIGYSVGWILSIITFDESDLDSALDGGLAEWDVLELGKREISSKDGHTLRYQLALIQLTQGETAQTAFSTWYCDESDYLFIVAMLYTTGYEPADMVLTMFQFLETFECH